MRTFKFVTFLAVVVFFILISRVFAVDEGRKELKGISLEWKPTEVVSALDAIDLSPFLKTTFAVSPFVDQRKNPEEIGKNVEKRGTDRDLPVTTKDNVASWLTDRFAHVLSEFDIDVTKSDAEFRIEADILKFYVTESSTYKGDLGLKVRLRRKNNDLLWEGMVSVSDSRFGSSYKADNYYEALSDSVILAVYNLLKNDQFNQAVLKSREASGK